MAENSVILSVEEEAKLLQPIDEYVGKIQDQIDALRVDGTDQVNNISNCIAIAKENKNLSKEEQAKLGFRKEEIRLYYPLISLNHFFEADDDVDEMQTRLEQFPEEVKKKLGDICVTHKKDRFCLHIPEQGSVYVHEHMAENEFIKKLVELMMNHGIKKEDILAIFQKEAKDIRVGDMHNGEFDFWVRFPEENEDEYYYCFKDEGCHMIYHRFLPEDYADFGF